MGVQLKDSDIETGFQQIEKAQKETNSRLKSIESSIRSISALLGLGLAAFLILHAHEIRSILVDWWAKGN
jgi:hypothetical protein